MSSTCLAVVCFAAWKKHYSLYPLTGAIRRTLAKELAAVDIEKGTVRFAYDAPVQSALIARIAKLLGAQMPAKPQSSPSLKGSTSHLRITG